jgi:hypothetical protein
MSHARITEVAHAGLGEQPVDVDLTVASVTNSRCATSRLDSPPAISRRTSTSRPVSPSGRSVSTVEGCSDRDAAARRAAWT